MKIRIINAFMCCPDLPENVRTVDWTKRLAGRENKKCREAQTDDFSSRNYCPAHFEEKRYLFCDTEAGIYGTELSIAWIHGNRNYLTFRITFRRQQCVTLVVMRLF